MKHTTTRLLLLTLATTVALSGCATTGGVSGTSDGAQKCNPWATGAIGAVLGAAIGAGKNSEAAAKGAIAGAALGALSCLVVNAHSRQTQSADTVQAEYRQANAGALPSAPKLMVYDTNISPGNRVTAGQAVEIKSNLKIVDGTQQRIASIREDMVLLDTTGKEIKRVGKDVSGTQAGGYENTFAFSFPKGVSQGVYGIRTELLVNGQVVGRNDESVQLVVEYSPAAYPVAVR
ncbi:conserved exported hypothetical protein [uncultured Stenotrophomonas sp.]|uniref:Glycine zipper domain-containing protein n=1 Tax=uncultured Stenotrophomonas sp. TaxID=165438 RepID=A0A1Y5Q3C0_9GAMM|nr:conserved exported hypothetical protein [uncultured Stenotrophomonas sp.]